MKTIRGVTLVELMVTVAIFSLLMLAVTPIFNMSVRQASAIETRNTLKTEGQDALRNIGRRLQESKRLFENSASDNAFLSRVQLTPAPPALAGSKLATSEETGSLSPSTTSFVTASVGNRLFFTSLAAVEDMTVNDVSANPHAVRIDKYQFNYYYVAQDSGNIGGKTKRSLWEWRSVPYVDYVQLMAITDGTERGNAAAVLYSRGYRYAWDSSATAVISAFYSLSSGGNIIADASHQISVETSRPMVKPLTGIMGPGFRYSVAPNTDTQFVLTKPVPQFAAASTDFPSGFEVVVVGPTSARTVLLRLVLVAQGVFKGFIDHEDILVVTARDVW